MMYLQKITLDLLIACLRRYGVINYTNIIVGDFNLPKICWRDFVCSSDYISTSFRDFVVTGGYTQLVNFDTREDSILDLVLTNDSKIVSSVSPRPPVGHSDHTAIDFRLDVRLVRDPDKNNDNAKNIGNEKDRYIYITGTGLILMDYNRVCPKSTGIIFLS